MPEIDCSCEQCYQRIYEWRGHFGSTALAAVDALFASTTTLANGKSKKIYDSISSRREYTKRALGEGLPFLYSTVEYDDDNNPVSLSTTEHNFR